MSPQGFSLPIGKCCHSRRLVRFLTSEGLIFGLRSYEISLPNLPPAKLKPQIHGAMNGVKWYPFSDSQLANSFSGKYRPFPPPCIYATKKIDRLIRFRLDWIRLDQMRVDQITLLTWQTCKSFRFLTSQVSHTVESFGLIIPHWPIQQDNAKPSASISIFQCPNLGDSTDITPPKLEGFGPCLQHLSGFWQEFH